MDEIWAIPMAVWPHGVNVVHDWAVGVDRDAKTVALAGGGAVPYDKLILSPGIDFVDGAVEGWDHPHKTPCPTPTRRARKPNCSRRS